MLLGSITVMRNLLNLKMHEVFDDWGIQSLNALFLQPFLYLCEIRPDVWACVCIFKQFPEAWALNLSQSLFISYDSN